MKNSTEKVAAVASQRNENKSFNIANESEGEKVPETEKLENDSVVGQPKSELQVEAPQAVLDKQKSEVTLVDNKEASVKADEVSQAKESVKEELKSDKQAFSKSATK